MPTTPKQPRTVTPPAAPKIPSPTPDKPTAILPRETISTDVTESRAGQRTTRGVWVDYFILSNGGEGTPKAVASTLHADEVDALRLALTSSTPEHMHATTFVPWGESIDSAIKTTTPQGIS